MGILDIFHEFKGLKGAIKEAMDMERKHIEMDNQDVMELDDREFYDAIYQRLDSKVEEADDNVGILNKKQLAYYLVYEFDAEMQNGGLCQYLCNSSGRNATQIIRALRELSFDRTARLLREFVIENDIDLNMFKGDIDYDQLLNQYDFDAFDDSYMELYEQEQIYSNMIRFARENYDTLM
ncbi:MAG: DUF4375 domain-containing protein [Eubacterium sp.]